jgi:hypothetical protein
MDSSSYSKSEICEGAVTVFLEVPPLESYALLTMLHPLLENILQTIDHFKISCLGAPFSWLGKPRNRMGQDLDHMADVLMGFHQSIFFKSNRVQFRSHPMQFLGFSNHEKGAPRQEIQSDQWSESSFQEVGEVL